MTSFSVLNSFLIIYFLVSLPFSYAGSPNAPAKPPIPPTKATTITEEMMNNICASKMVTKMDYCRNVLIVFIGTSSQNPFQLLAGTFLHSAQYGTSTALSLFSLKYHTTYVDLKERNGKCVQWLKSIEEILRGDAEEQLRTGSKQAFKRSIDKAILTARTINKFVHQQLADEPVPDAGALIDQLSPISAICSYNL